MPSNAEVPTSEYVRESAQRVLTTWRQMPRSLRQVAISMGLLDAKWLDYPDDGSHGNNGGQNPDGLES